MIGRIKRAYSVEIAKFLRHKLTFFGPLLLVFVIICVPLVYPLSRDGNSDYGFVAYATASSLNLVGLLLLLTFSAGLISSEVSTGTIRMALVRPIRRWEFVIAKILVGATYAFVLTLTTALASWLLGNVRGELTGVTYGGELLISSREMIVAYLIGMALYLLPQTTVVAFAVMVSSMTRRTGTSTALVVGLWVAVDAVKYPLGIAPYLFTTHLERPWQVFADASQGISTPWLEVVRHTAPTSLAALAIFSIIACVAFQRKNLYA